MGRYGDPIVQRISGVQTEAIQLSASLHKWRIEKAVMDEQSTKRLDAKRPCGSGSDHEAVFAAQPPWSSVNNCTKDISYFMDL